jgi:ribosomal protein S27AE
VKRLGYPTARYDFNKERPPKGKAGAIEYKEVECSECGYVTQNIKCRTETITTKKSVTKRKLCPMCNAVIDEVVTDAKKVQRLRLLANIADTSDITDAEIRQFVYQVAREMGYKEGWVYYVAKMYNSNPAKKEEVKILYNKWRHDLIKTSTAASNLKKLQKS